MKIRKAIRQCLEAHGIPAGAVSKTAGGNLRIELTRCTIFTGSTPSDRRAVKNLSAMLKRGGA